MDEFANVTKTSRVETRNPPCYARKTSYSSAINLMTRQQVLDLYFMDARSKLIDLAAFLDRVDRAEGPADFRITALRSALKELTGGSKEKAKQVLLMLSDPTAEPIPSATTKAASGAYSGAPN